MKILLVTHSYGLNGAAILLRDSAKHWVQKKGWQVDALMSDEELALYGQDLIDMGITPKQTVSGQTGEYDVALVNTLLDIEFVTKLSPSMQVVLWVHEGNTLLFNWNIGLSSLVRGFAQCSRIVFQTTWQSEHVFKSFIDHLPAQRIQHVPSGVVTEGVPHKSSHAINGPIKLITLGTVYPRKRQIDLIHAVDQLAAKYTIECYVLGDFNQANDWLPRIHKDLNNPNAHIKWLGGIKDREKINALLLEADIACFPSGDESHPLALLEAGVCALPMVLSELPPYSHIGWANGKNCLMHPTGDIALLAAQIERLITDAGLRARLGNNARKLVLNKYSKTKFFENMDKVMAPFEKKTQ
jgi:glycosyltransferase involved in cell wall biosynthesis